MTTPPNHNTADQSGADERAILKGHASLAEMVSTHIGQWRDALCFLSESCKREGNFDSFSHVVHELTALNDIEKACAALASTQPAPDSEQVSVYVTKGKDGYDVFGSVPSNTSLHPGINMLYATPQPFPAPAVQSGELPELPEPLGYMSPCDVKNLVSNTEQYRGRNYNIKSTVFLDSGFSAGSATDRIFTVDQMQAYARQSIAQTAPAVAGEAVKFDIEEVDDETIKYSLNGEHLITANHEDDGWSGMERISDLMTSIENALNRAAPSQGAKQNG